MSCDIRRSYAATLADTGPVDVEIRGGRGPTSLPVISEDSSITSGIPVMGEGARINPSVGDPIVEATSASLDMDHDCRCEPLEL